MANNQSIEREHIGIAAEDKLPGSRELKVYCSEMLPFIQGNLTAIENNATVNINDKHVGKSQTSVTTTNAITATYKDMVSNRQDPPDVVRGEQVKIFQYSNSKTFYWSSTGRDDNLRKTEHQRISISNSQTTGGDRDDDNTYSIELDSRDGKKNITIRTSKGGGEEFQYCIKLDAGSGTIQMCDDADNEFFLDTKEKIVRLRNSDGSMITVDKKNAIMIAPEDIILKGDRSIIMDTPSFTTQNTTGGSGVTAWNSNAMAINVNDSFVVTGASIGINGAVVMPKSLVVGSCQAESYSTGKVKG